MAAGTTRVEVAFDGADDAALTQAALFAAGALGTWERDESIVAWFDAQGPVDAVIEIFGSHRITHAHEPDRDWQERWKAGIGPVTAGRFQVVPSWLADQHPRSGDDIVIVLDPGRAFGSGHHATTQLCLELLDDVDERHGLAGRTVADVGCGSGILAIAAAALGATVIAVDTDPAAIEVTTANARANRVSVDVRLGGIEVVDEPADVVLANLVTDLIAALAAPLARRADQYLVVSGIAATRHQVALGPLADNGFTVLDQRERDGWVAARLDRTDKAAP